MVVGGGCPDLEGGFGKLDRSSGTALSSAYWRGLSSAPRAELSVGGIDIAPDDDSVTGKGS
jgi:hypothetical protein